MTHKKLSRKEKREKLIFEFKRKTIHFLASLYIAAYWIIMKILGHQIAMLFLVATLMFFITLEFFRIAEHRRIPIFHILWRAKEENSLGGQVYFMLGLIIALAVFDFDIALAVVLMTVFGDMAAAIFGIAFGKHWIKKLNETAWEGVIAELVVDIAIGLLILGNWVIVIPIALMATLVETIFSHVDDNLAIPLFAGFIGQCIKLILH